MISKAYKKLGAAKGLKAINGAAVKFADIP